VRFGTVTATVARVDRGTETRNIRQGQAALKRGSCWRYSKRRPPGADRDYGLATLREPPRRY
jgi:Ni/Co efflux regulator RcnB